MECLIQTKKFMRAKGMKSCWDHRTKVLECCWAKRKQKLPKIYFQTIEWNATFKENMKHINQVINLAHSQRSYEIKQFTLINAYIHYGPDIKSATSNKTA